MTDTADHSLSRRSALKSMGIVGGAAALTMALPGCQPPLPDGVTFHTYSFVAFRATDLSAQPNLTGNGAFCAAGGEMRANLQMPAGAELLQVQFVTHNATSSAQPVAVLRTPLLGGPSETLASVEAPVSDPGIFAAVTATLDHTVSAESAYVAVATTTQPDFRIWSVQVAYLPPTA